MMLFLAPWLDLSTSVRSIQPLVHSTQVVTEFGLAVDERTRNNLERTGLEQLGAAWSDLTVERRDRLPRNQFLSLPSCGKWVLFDHHIPTVYDRSDVFLQETYE